MDGGLWYCTGGNDEDHHQEKENKKAKLLSEEVLQITEKRREAKGKGDKERYKFVCRVPKNCKEIRKPSSVINPKK